LYQVGSLRRSGNFLASKQERRTSPLPDHLDLIVTQHPDVSRQGDEVGSRNGGHGASVGGGRIHAVGHAYLSFYDGQDEVQGYAEKNVMVGLEKSKALPTPVAHGRPAASQPMFQAT
jgi:hypothetical protein